MIIARIIQAVKYRLLLAFIHKIRYPYLVKKISKKPKIKVAFFALFDSVWKCDAVYQMMVASPRFEPVIVVCPVVNYGRENMLQKMSDCYNMFASKGYNVVKSYDEETDTYLDVKKEICPDIVFYTNPYQGLIDDRYYISEYFDALTLYVPYAMEESDNEAFFNQRLQNYVWKVLAQTKYHLIEFSKYQDLSCANVQTFGYIGADDFMKESEGNEMIWHKDDGKRRKRIIWAPHHTIGGGCVIDYSCFLDYASYFLELADKYVDEIQIAFKPHPILRSNLNEVWGEERTNCYYAEWARRSNTILREGDYSELFKTSDAMIHDSGGFTGEYLLVDKPVIRTVKDKRSLDKFNSFGKMCLEQHEFAYNKEDVENFVLRVINGEDLKKEQRSQFVNSVLRGETSPAQEFIKYLENTLTVK